MTKPLAIFSRHTLLDGHPFGFLTSPGENFGSPILGAWPHNLGDSYVAKALARLLSIDEYYVITRDASKAQFDVLNSECSAVIVLAQNALQYGWFEKNLPVAYLEKIKIPMVLISLGVQYRFHEEIKLSSDDQKSLRWLHDHAESSQVRGNISAELLEKAGIRNTRVLGCPSILANSPKQAQIHSVKYNRSAYLLTDMGAIPDIHHWQFKLMEQLNNISEDLSVVCQGGEYVLQSFIRARDGDEINRTALEEVTTTRSVSAAQFGLMDQSAFNLIRVKTERSSLSELRKSVEWYYREANSSVVTKILSDSISADSVSELRRHCRAWGLCLSSRLHGGILALNESVPTVFAVHDYRLKELVELYNLPHVSFETKQSPNLSETLVNASWEHLTALREQVARQFVDFFDENNVPHNLGRL